MHAPIDSYDDSSSEYQSAMDSDTVGTAHTIALTVMLGMLTASIVDPRMSRAMVQHIGRIMEEAVCTKSCHWLRVSCLQSV